MRRGTARRGRGAPPLRRAHPHGHGEDHEADAKLAVGTLGAEVVDARQPEGGDSLAPLALDRVRKRDLEQRGRRLQQRHGHGRAVGAHALQPVVCEWHVRGVHEVLDEEVERVGQLAHRRAAEVGERGPELERRVRLALAARARAERVAEPVQPRPQNVAHHGRAHAARGRADGRALGRLRHARARAARVELPAVVGALDAARLGVDVPLRERREPVRARVREHRPRALVLPHDVFAARDLHARGAERRERVDRADG